MEFIGESIETRTIRVHEYGRIVREALSPEEISTSEQGWDVTDIQLDSTGDFQSLELALEYEDHMQVMSAALDRTLKHVVLESISGRRQPQKERNEHRGTLPLPAQNRSMQEVII